MRLPAALLSCVLSWGAFSSHIAAVVAPPPEHDDAEPCRQAALQVKEAQRRVAQGDAPGAITQLQSALDLCPGNASATLELIRARAAARQFAEAERTAREFLTTSPKSEPGQFLLAYSVFMQQRFQEAGKTLMKLLDQNSQNADAHKLMGLILFFYKEDMTAERELQIALRLHPRDEEALYYLGRIYYTQNNFPPAVSTFQQLIGINPKSYKAFDYLGLCYQAQGKMENAIAAFQKAQALARDLEPSYEWPFANLAELLIQEKRIAEALPYAREAVRLNARSARNQYLLGRALAHAQKTAESMECLRKAVELDPAYAEPHYLLGQLYHKSGRYEEAVREFALFDRISKQTPHKKR